MTLKFNLCLVTMTNFARGNSNEFVLVKYIKPLICNANQKRVHVYKILQIWSSKLSSTNSLLPFYSTEYILQKTILLQKTSLVTVLV